MHVGERSTASDAECQIHRFRWWNRPVIETYRNAVDQATRNDIAAAAAAHHELGRDYDGAIAEGLVERIGAEIDKRVDARLGANSRRSDSSAEVARASRRQAMWTGAGAGAGITGIVAMMANMHGGTPVAGWVVAVWVLFAIAAIGTTWVRRYRITRRG
jgi:hypothetical protein